MITMKFRNRITGETYHDASVETLGWLEEAMEDAANGWQISIDDVIVDSLHCQDFGDVTEIARYAFPENSEYSEAFED